MKGIWLTATALSALSVALPALKSMPVKLIYNPSDSAATGFYWVDQSPARRGDMVLVQVPITFQTLVAERGYLPPDVPLLKRVVALEGDEVCRIGPVITRNGRHVATALAQDHAGRSLPEWVGCHSLGPSDLFLLQDHPRSFDGRYFGPIDRRLVIGRVRALRWPWRKRSQI